MPEGFINLTEGSGKKAHTFQRTIGANTVEDSVSIVGIPYLATYTACPAAPVSAATAASHLMQLMAGASLNVYLYRVELYQVALATAAALDQLELVRLTTAGTGGTAVTPAPHDTSDAASGATAMTLPTIKGTEGTFLQRRSGQFTQTVATQASGPEAGLIAKWDAADMFGKPWRIAAGTANGIALKNPTARANATVLPVFYFFEANH